MKRPFRRFQPKLSERARILKFNAADAFYAAAAEVEPKFQQEVPPERKYTKRTDGSSEHKEQCAVIEWWRKACGVYRLPEFVLFAIPNGAHLASGYIGAGKLKREGLRPGMLDLVLAVPRGESHGKFIEMKYGSNKPSPEQNAVIAHFKYAGYSVGVHWSADSAISAIKEYLG